jgi:hypothetical protein
MTSASWVQVVEVGSLMKKPIYMGSVHLIQSMRKSYISSRAEAALEADRRGLTS